MHPPEDSPFTKPEPQVIYRSFLLRLRLVRHGVEQKRQYFLKDIHTQEELYFISEDELIAFLSDLFNQLED